MNSFIQAFALASVVNRLPASGKPELAHSDA